MVFLVEWVRIHQPDSDPETLVAPLPGFPAIEGSGRSGPYLQGEAQGAARFSRGEGCWYQDGVVYFTDTNARPVGKGVVWAYRPLPGGTDGGELVALFVSPSAGAADNPDNITVSPRGGLLVCEDGGGEVGPAGREFGTRLLAITPNGEALAFAENNLILESPMPDRPFIEPGDYRGREFAGACFDPTGRYLFVNIQTPGLTIAITGPWRRSFL
jgi:secreted PhoX family phosphatase